MLAAVHAVPLGTEALQRTGEVRPSEPRRRPPPKVANGMLHIVRLVRERLTQGAQSLFYGLDVRAGRGGIGVWPQGSIRRLQEGERVGLVAQRCPGGEL